MKIYYQRHRKSFHLYPSTNVSPNTLLVFLTLNKNFKTEMLSSVNGSLQDKMSQSKLSKAQDKMFQSKLSKAQIYDSKQMSSTVYKLLTLLSKNLPFRRKIILKQHILTQNCQFYLKLLFLENLSLEVSNLHHNR